MNWYKKALNLGEIKARLEKSLGLEKYAPTKEEIKEMKRKNKEKSKKNDKDDGCQHSLDIHCDGGDDGW